MSVTRLSPRQLGSGTADSTTYLRGDQTWQTISITAVPSTGTSGATLRDNGTSWSSTTNLYNDGTNIGIRLTSSLDGRLHIKPDSTSKVGQVIELSSSQTADAFQIHDSAGATLARFDSEGYLGIQWAPTNPLRVASSFTPSSDDFSIFVIDGSLTSGQNSMKGITVSSPITATTSTGTAVGTLAFPTFDAETGVNISSAVAAHAKNKHRRRRREHFSNDLAIS